MPERSGLQYLCEGSQIYPAVGVLVLTVVSLWLCFCVQELTILFLAPGMSSVSPFLVFPTPVGGGSMATSCVSSDWCNVS